jgi:hypothetical protein
MRGVIKPIPKHIQEECKVRFKIQGKNLVYKFDGSLAGSMLGPYRRVKVKGINIYAQRVCWLITHGYDPYPFLIDHKDQDGTNNCPSNLRICKPSQNLFNRDKPSHNTSGFKGVNYCKESNKWRVRISAFNRRYHVGRYDNLEDAERAFLEASKKYHKDFTNLCVEGPDV